jgi:DNA-binding NarL/FixJ family response regulator
LPKCILIVDDDEYLRKLVRDFLETQTGYDPCGEAVDGYDAIEKAQELKPDLIILDMSMPRMNGIEAARRLKKLLPQTPIILFTSHSAFRIFDVGALGIDAVIGKHDGMSSLKGSMQALLQEA